MSKLGGILSAGTKSVAREALGKLGEEGGARPVEVSHRAGPGPAPSPERHADPVWAPRIEPSTDGRVPSAGTSVSASRSEDQALDQMMELVPAAIGKTSSALTKGAEGIESSIREGTASTVGLLRELAGLLRRTGEEDPGTGRGLPGKGKDRADPGKEEDGLPSLGAKQRRGPRASPKKNRNRARSRSRLRRVRRSMRGRGPRVRARQTETPRPGILERVRPRNLLRMGLEEIKGGLVQGLVLAVGEAGINKLFHGSWFPTDEETLDSIRESWRSHGIDVDDPEVDRAIRSLQGDRVVETLKEVYEALSRPLDDDEKELQRQNRIMDNRQSGWGVRVPGATESNPGKDWDDRVRPSTPAGIPEAEPPPSMDGFPEPEPQATPWQAISFAGDEVPSPAKASSLTIRAKKITFSAREFSFDGSNSGGEDGVMDAAYHPGEGSTQGPGGYDPGGNSGGRGDPGPSGEGSSGGSEGGGTDDAGSAPTVKAKRFVAPSAPGPQGAIDSAGKNIRDVDVPDPDSSRGPGTPSPGMLTEPEVADWWKKRNPRGSKLYGKDGKPLVSPELLHAAAQGAIEFERRNPNYRVEMYGPAGGVRHSGSTGNHGLQRLVGDRDVHGGALDRVIIDKRTGRMLTNHPGRNHQNQGTVGQNAPLYQELYNESLYAGSVLYPGYEKRARHGGYFVSSNPMDIMHEDLLGEKGQAGGSNLGGFTASQMLAWNIKKNNRIGTREDFVRQRDERYPPNRPGPIADAPAVPEERPVPVAATPTVRSPPPKPDYVEAAPSPGTSPTRRGDPAPSGNRKAPARGEEEEATSRNKGTPMPSFTDYQFPNNREKV